MTFLVFALDNMTDFGLFLLFLSKRVVHSLTSPTMDTDMKSRHARLCVCTTPVVLANMSARAVSREVINSGLHSDPRRHVQRTKFTSSRLV